MQGPERLIEQQNKKWHSLSLQEAIHGLGSTPDEGLSRDEAIRRLGVFGPNRLEEKPPRTLASMFIGQLKETLVLVLIAASAISALLGELKDAAVIFAIVFMNALLGALQENKAESALKALKAMVRPRAKVVRSGVVSEIPVDEVVPGDVIFLDAGDLVPADARLIEAVRLSVDESALTGESVPVEKDPHANLPGNTFLGERTNMLFMGTVVTAGRAKALVVSTGMGTEIGAIAELLKETAQEPTPLQRRLAALGKCLSLAALGIIAVVFLAGVFRGEGLLDMFMTSVSLAVAAVPEGLPAVVTITLALGLQRMSRRKAIIRKLSAVETLGTATVICSDKTGTLTKNEMTVTEIFTPLGHWRVGGAGYNPAGSFERVDSAGGEFVDEYLKRVLTGAVLCCDARISPSDRVPGHPGPGDRERTPQAEGRTCQESQSLSDSFTIIGDPTEGALVIAALKAGLSQEELNRRCPRLSEIPFDPSRKMMTTFHAAEGRVLSFTKGAPDVVLSRCTKVYGKDMGEEPLTEELKRLLLEANRMMASRGLRVLALASRGWQTVPENPDPAGPSSAETEMTFMALFGMHDPPRPEAVRAVSMCKRAGIMPVMITGDHQITATAVAEQVGIFGRDAMTLTGEDLERIDDRELSQMTPRTQVYARVPPKHKLRIVRALQSHGHVVAMTGDGVNDAPALRQADIGIAMGITGTEVAKEASDMVILDDNFATIVNAVEEGRVIFDNIRRSIHYLLSCNVGEILAIFFAILIGIGSPLTPIQILWLNLVTDGPPALALGLERAYGGVMSRPPRNPREGVFSGGLGFKIFWQGLLIGIVSFTAYGVALTSGRSVEEAHTMAFLTMSLAQLFHSFDVRNESSLLKIGLLSNPHLVYAFLISLGLQLVVVLSPPLRELFGTVQPAGIDWALILALSLGPAAAVELTKAIAAGRSR